MKQALTISVALALTACAANPKKTIQTLNESDPRYATQACLDARNIALEYNDKVLARAGAGILLGLALGPFGIPLAMASDAHQNSERDAINQEIERRCVTPGGPPEVRAAAEAAAAESGRAATEADAAAVGATEAVGAAARAPLPQ